MTINVQLHQRPAGDIADQIVALTAQLTDGWFTPNVPGYVRRDLSFQDVFCLYEAGELRSFLMFTCLDGNLQITLMGTDPRCRRRGYGSRLMEHFLAYARVLGFEKVVAFTVPADVKPAYAAIIAFYRKHGFVEVKRYNELWENGAVELVKNLRPVPAEP